MVKSKLTNKLITTFLKGTLVVCLLFCFLTLNAQNNTTKTIDFRNVEKTLLSLPDEAIVQQLKYDFKVVDSLYFYEHSIKEDLLTAHSKNDFELHLGDTTFIYKLECNEPIIETCYQYLGYSDNGNVHLVSKCKEVCELYLIDSYNGFTQSLESEYDEGAFPIFLPGYMVVYSSYFDASFSEYYEYRSKLYIYKMNSDHDLKNRFKYLGSINSKQWSIEELYQSKTENSLMMKIYDKRNEYDYIEITIE
jgi:hypothetical protein